MSGHNLNDPFARSVAALHWLRRFLLLAVYVLANPQLAESEDNLEVVIYSVQLCIVVVELFAVIPFQHYRRNTTFVPQFFILVLACAEIALSVFCIRKDPPFPHLILCCGAYHWITIITVAALRPYRLWDVYQPTVSHKKRPSSSLGLELSNSSSTVLSELAKRHQGRPYPVVPVSSSGPNPALNAPSNETQNAAAGPRFDPVVYYSAAVAETRHNPQWKDYIRQWFVAVYLTWEVLAVVGSQKLSERSADGGSTEFPRWNS
ncbi:hypothetical protein V8F06_011820 [Rhypophila decipiens]